MTRACPDPRALKVSVVELCLHVAPGRASVIHRHSQLAASRDAVRELYEREEFAEPVEARVEGDGQRGWCTTLPSCGVHRALGQNCGAPGDAGTD